MNIHLILFLIFVLAVSILLWRNRSKVCVSGWPPIFYILLYRDSWGLKLMDWLALKIPRVVRSFGWFSILIGIFGMLLIVVQLFFSVISFFISPSTAVGVALVLPFQVKGALFVPFLYWIGAIFLIAVTHEFAHGVVARAHKITVKSSGFAVLSIFVPIIPAAFVEPSEQQLAKKRTSVQLSVFSAGPIINIVLAFLVAFAFGVGIPGLIPQSVTSHTAIIDVGSSASNILELESINISKVIPDSPAFKAGILPNTKLLAIDDISSLSKNFSLLLQSLKPNQRIKVETSNGVFNVALASHPQNIERAFLGVEFSPKTRITDDAVLKYGNFGVELLIGFATFLSWFVLLSFGIGLFNLLPLGPIDGGRMLKAVLNHWFAEKGDVVWKYISGVLLIVLLILIFGSFIGAHI